jgi:hypothetical protein
VELTAEEDREAGRLGGWEAGRRMRILLPAMGEKEQATYLLLSLVVSNTDVKPVHGARPIDQEPVSPELRRDAHSHERPFRRL